MARKTFIPTIGTRVHYQGCPGDQGVVEDSREELKFAKNGGGGWNTGNSYGSSVMVTLYEVRWDEGKVGWHRVEELRPV